MSFYDKIQDDSLAFNQDLGDTNTESAILPDDAVDPNSFFLANLYEVQAGDSLWKIAEETYGDGSQWTKIYDANRDIIGDNPDLIHAEQNLFIPAAETETINDAFNEINVEVIDPVVSAPVTNDGTLEENLMPADVWDVSDITGDIGAEDVVNAVAIAGDLLQGIGAVQDLLNTEDNDSFAAEAGEVIESFTDVIDGIMDFS